MQILWSVVIPPVIFAWACGTANLPARAPVVPGSPERSTTELYAVGNPVTGALSLNEQIEQSFFPYRQGPPRVPGIESGTAITQENWQVAQSVLSQQLVEAVHAGELSILVQETTDLPVSQEYQAATRASAQGVMLDADGNVSQYHAGLPFPILDPADTRAGLKAAWNARYAESGDVVQRLETLEVRDYAGAYQHGFSFSYARAYGMHRAKPER